MASRARPPSKATLKQVMGQMATTSKQRDPI
ncbi:hypothetical protein COLO4_15156 [Corchorus olitorius]|uniref:Uncharacterized protein n=1 Tax=Corchorus olitorius TaxID=93759 RepID=A0A1R3JP69_9ROSI|nr:hypothetical protein COLO4_15156 [Corchorus olitorius]